MEDKEQKRKEYLKAYYQAKKDKIKAQSKASAENNKDKVKEYQKEYGKTYRELNKDNMVKYQKEYQKEYGKVYYELNKDKKREYYKVWQKNKLKTDPIYKMSVMIRNSILRTLKSNNLTKPSTTELILGCSFEKFKLYLESKFEPWMNWNNHGLYNGELNYGWDIDHIIPSSSGLNCDDIIKLNHYTNLQPLCSYTNRVIKRDNQ